MKTLLSLLTITTLSTSLVSNVNGFLNNQINDVNKTKSTPNISKIVGTNKNINKAITFVNNTVWTGTSNQFPTSGGLYKSTDDTNFNQVSGLDNKSQLDSLVTSKDGTLYLAYGEWLYKSTDGNTFNRINTPNSYANYLTINLDNTLYVASKNILYQSTDGNTFNQIYNFGDNNYITKINIAPNNTIYAIVQNQGNNTLYKSFDNGYHFMQIPNIQWINDITIAKDNTVYVSNGSLYKSTDNGNNYVEIPNSKQLALSDMDVSPNGTLYIESPTDLWKLNSDNTFTKIWSFSEIVINITAAQNGLLWIGTFEGLYKVWFT